MSIDPRLASKLDQAMATLKPKRAANGACITSFVTELTKRCQTRAAFGILLDGVAHQVSPSQIRVTRTTVDLGPVRIRLGGIQLDWTENDDDTTTTFYSFYTADQDNDFEAFPHRLDFAA